MGESNGIRLFDGENTGVVSPWEFDEIRKWGTSVFELSSEAKNHGDNGYRFVIGDTFYSTYGTGNFADKDEIYARYFFKILTGCRIDGSYKEWTIFQLFDSLVKTLVSVRLRTASTSPYDWKALRFKLINTSGGSSLSKYFDKDVWHRVDVHYLSGVLGVGGCSIWYDGDLIYSSYSTYDTSMWKVDRVTIGSLYAQQYPRLGSEMHFDDIKLDTKFIGPYAPANEITAWVISARKAGSPASLAAKTIPPSIVSIAKEAGEPAVEKVDRPLVPSIGDIKGPF